MKNILFTHSYFLKFDPKQWKLGQPYAPLGTLYAASVMRENGYNVALHDVMFADSPTEVISSIKQNTPGYFIIYDDGFNYLTKMCLTNMREAAFTMIEIAKQNNCIVIVSSSDSTDHFEKYLNTGADFVIIGEAENTLLQLVNARERGETDFTLIAGIAYKTAGAFVKTQKRSVIKDLDMLPLPAWDLVNIEPYKNMWLKSVGYFSINISTTRGCPFKCNWCAKPIYGNRYNARSPENVVEELKMLQEKFAYEHVWFCDDIFGLKPGWVSAFAELIKKEELTIKFKIQSRADLLVQENYVEALAKSGCENVWMGAESGSQKILDAMDKGITVEQIQKATEQLKKHKIHPSFFIQFGYLGETKEDIRLTIKMINRLLPHEIGISVSYPLPGTIFYEKVRSEMYLKTNWTDSDEMALMFSNTYQPSFYKQLHCYVHKSYRKHLALESFFQLLKKPFSIQKNAIKKAASAFYYLPAAFIEKIKLRRLEKV